MVVQALEYNEDDTRTIRNLYFMKNDSDLSIWFSDNLGRDLDYGPYYEFDHYTMNKLIAEYELALIDKGEFANHPYMTKDECQEILTTLKDYKKNRGVNYEDTYFLFSQS